MSDLITAILKPPPSCAEAMAGCKSAQQSACAHECDMGKASSHITRNSSDYGCMDCVLDYPDVTRLQMLPSWSCSLRLSAALMRLSWRACRDAQSGMSWMQHGAPERLISQWQCGHGRRRDYQVSLFSHIHTPVWEAPGSFK